MIFWALLVYFGLGIIGTLSAMFEITHRSPNMSMSHENCYFDVHALRCFAAVNVMLNLPNVQGRNLPNLNFWVSEVKKVKFGSVEKWGVNVEMSLYLRRHKYLVKEVY